MQRHGYIRRQILTVGNVLVTLYIALGDRLVEQAYRPH